MVSSNYDCVLVRFGEIGSKKGYVRNEMAELLRARVQEKLESEGFDFSKVSRINGRIVVRGVSEGVDIAESVSVLPGVASTSPSVNCSAEKEDFFEEALKIDINGSFGVRCSVSRNELSGSDLEEELGGKLLDVNEDSFVDLDNPDMWVRVEVRDDEAFVFNSVLEGVDGLPVGSQRNLGVLLSGGIDSPVAAYLLLKRGCDLQPIYIYNKPISAEDHRLRFEEILKELKKFHPGRDWSYNLVDFSEINNVLMKNVGSGRMIIHRIIMFKVAERICESKGLEGIVTGESIGQKSSQTISNLDFTSSKINLTIFRPLSGFNKEEIVDIAKNIGTYETSTINSACSSLSPEEPATNPPEYEFEEFCKDHNIERLVNSAIEKCKEVDI